MNMCGVSGKGVVLLHDGRLFIASLRSDIDPIAYYIDDLGFIQHVYKKSLYGGHIIKELEKL